VARRTCRAKAVGIRGNLRRTMRWALVWAVIAAVMLVPFVLFEQQFNHLAITAVQSGRSSWGAALAIAALLSLDVFLPVPSSVVSTAAGVLFGLVRGAALVWIAMTAGCLIGYAFGARASSIAGRFVGRDSLERAASLTRRHGSWALVLCRPVPVLAEASIVFAGLVGAPFRRFLTVVAGANLGIALGYAAFGAYSMRVGSFVAAFVGAIVIPGILMGIWRHVTSRRSP
jgi:uncharacterized membrane protein YdjX (TVP38/TMEM64 family)